MFDHVGQPHTYTATLLPVPDGIIKRLNQILWSFLWKGKDKISRALAVKTTNQGGLNMIDLEGHFQALKSSWIPRIIDSNDKWSLLAKQWFNKLGQNIALKMNFEKIEHFPAIKQIPLFYQEVIHGFSKAKHSSLPVNEDQLKKQVIWGNKFLTYNNHQNQCRTLYVKQWINADIVTVRGLPYENGNLNCRKTRR